MSLVSQRSAVLVVAAGVAAGPVSLIVRQIKQLSTGVSVARISPAFVSSDSWILLALRSAGSERPARLRTILDSATGINKATPTAEELDGALNRLLAAGFIAQEKDGLQLTESAHTMIAKASKRRQGILDLWEAVDRVLACPCCGPNLRAVRRRITITRSEVRNAYKA